MKKNANKKSLFISVYSAFVVIAGAFPVVASANADLVKLAERGQTEQIRQMLKDGADVNSKLNDGSTTLHWAVLNDQQDVVKMLLDAGADPLAVNRNGISPLFLAAQNGNEVIVASLLDAGADPNTLAENGETILMTAAHTGKAEVVNVLLENGALVDARDPEFQQTALMIAVREGHTAVVDTLIRYGTNVDAKTREGGLGVYLPPCKGTGCGSEGVGINRSGVPQRGERHDVKGGMTPLLYAARDGRLEEARLLLENGADLEVAEVNGIEPLLMATLNNQLEVANLLLDHGANVNVDDFYGRTPLFALVDYRNIDMNTEIQDAPKDNGVDRPAILPTIARLIEAGADVNARTKEWPPEKKWLYTLNDVSWVDMTGQTPFIRASEAGDVEVMKLLVEHGADPHITTYEGTTALMAAAGVNWTVAQTYTVSPEASLEAVKMNVELGADVNATNSMGLTALLGAANNGGNDIIRFLASQGADLNAKDAVGRTALSWAEGVFLAAVGATQKPETIALLKELMSEAGIAYAQ
ncbi:MAG: ankyrin repeat domain-containing protein [Pseudomonadota bacterium]